MKKNSQPLNIFISIAAAIVLLLASCTPVKNVVYFENLPKDMNVQMVDSNFELRIRKNDILSITVISPDPITTPLFNGVQSASTSLEQPGGKIASNEGGFQVDNDGNITMYKLGTIHVEGLTRNGLKLMLQKNLSPYLKDPVVTVRFLSNHVTILGEVMRPQVLTMTTEKLSILEAMGMTGDILITGRKDNILVIRETATGKQLKRLNLTDKSIFNSPFFYLKPDDIVYVEPTTTKIKNSGSAPQTIGYLIAALSVVLTLLLNLLR